MRPVNLLFFLVLQILPFQYRTTSGFPPESTVQIRQAKPLFQSEDPIELVISTHITALWNDRGEEPEYHPVDIGLRDSSGQLFFLPARVRTRGHFRKQKNICTNPPLLLNFQKEARIKGTIMAGQNKLKLVMPCRNRELVVREYLLYRVYQLLTPLSLRARLATVILSDSATRSIKDTLSGMLLEPPEQVAARNDMITIDRDNLKAQYLVPSDFHLMAVFQYFAANTDWGIEYQHNIELVSNAVDFPATPIPYDFDMSGMVNAPYAVPAEDLKLSSVRVRRYRGYCLDNLDQLQPVFNLFLQKRTEIETLYRQTSGLSDQYRRRSLDFIADFYEVIGSRRKADNEFSYPCRTGGTGDIIISGMKKDRRD